MLELPAHATVADLRRTSGRDDIRAGRLLERSAVAVNNEFADDTVELTA